MSNFSLPFDSSIYLYDHAKDLCRQIELTPHLTLKKGMNGGLFIKPTPNNWDKAGAYDDDMFIILKDGISLTESVHGVKEFSITNMTGDYRRVFQRPIDYTWELLTYTDNSEALANTDLDIMSGPKTIDLVTNKSSINLSLDDKVDYMQTTKSDGSDSFVVEDQDGVIAQVECDNSDPKAALKLSLTLPASCYATMAIRELLKSSTSVAYQKAMNQ